MGNSILGEILDTEPAFCDEVHMQEVLVEMQEKIPEYKYIPSKFETRNYHPEEMSTQEIAGALIDMVKEFDAYNVMDQDISEEDMIRDITINLMADNGMREYAPFLKDVMEESEHLAPKAEMLMERISRMGR